MRLLSLKLFKLTDEWGFIPLWGVNCVVEMLMKAISDLCRISTLRTFSTCFVLVWFSSQTNLLYDIGLNASTFSIHKSLINSSINDFITLWYGCFLKKFTEIYSREQWWKIVYHPLLFTWDTLKKQGQIYLPMYADWGDHQVCTMLFLYKIFL